MVAGTLPRIEAYMPTLHTLNFVNIFSPIHERLDAFVRDDP
ncbi:uncharacterized protein METZ01_LOCUS464957, partial [marine metagenome]